ncbi:MAG: peptidoglycan-binding domain-containing protein, partial [Planctomycetota bacterium]
DEVAAGGATLTINQGGQGVSSLQSRLNQLGATPPLAVDGKLGPLSFGALRDAQRQLGLPETGVLDRTTLAAIDAAIASGKSLSISGSGGAGGRGARRGRDGTGATGGNGGADGHDACSPSWSSRAQWPRRPPLRAEPGRPRGRAQLAARRHDR